MKKMLRLMDQKIDDYVSIFHNSLIVLFLIQLFSLVMLVGVMISPMLLFQEDIWIHLLALIVILFSPITVINAIFAFKNANWHFGNTFTNRMTIWFD